MKIVLMLKSFKDEGAGISVKLATQELKSKVISLLQQDKRQEALNILKDSEPEEYVPARSRLKEPYLTVFAENW
jgi:hypothetical protein